MDTAGAQHERELVDALARSDHSAFGELFDRHSAAVFRYAWSLLEQRSDVDDVVQETFLTAWRRSRELSTGDAGLLPWLLVTCRNTAANANRRHRRHAAIELTDAAPLTLEQQRRRDREQAVEQLRWVRVELDALPQPEQRLVRMCLIDGRPYDEAARELGLTPPAARKRIQRVRARLRELRAQRGED